MLTIDLAAVSFFGSAGVTALVWVSQRPEAAGKHVRVVANRRIVTGPLELTGLLGRLDVQGTPEGAVRPGARVRADPDAACRTPRAARPSAVGHHGPGGATADGRG